VRGDSGAVAHPTRTDDQDIGYVGTHRVFPLSKNLRLAKNYSKAERQRTFICEIINKAGGYLPNKIDEGLLDS
jgi:hypothetical protein